MGLSKRERLARVLDTLGFSRLCSWLPRQPLLLIVNYHRLGNVAENRFDDGVFSATAADFATHLAFLRDHFRVLHLDALLNLAANGFVCQEPSVLITFDDGYRDNFDIGLPALTRHGLTATFFLATSYLDHPRLPWWDRLAFIVRQTRQQQITLDLQPPWHVDLRTTPRATAIRQLLHYFKTMRQGEPELFFQHLEERAEVRVDDDAQGRELFMSWDHVAQLAAAGMGIGSHTHTHRILAQLSEAEESQELRISKSTLEARLARPILTLSYPVGQRLISFTDRTKHATAAAGYQVAFSFDGGVNRPRATDPFDVRRFGPEAGDSPARFRTRLLCAATFGHAF